MPFDKVTLNFARLYQFNVENIIPDTATQILIYAKTHCGNAYLKSAMFMDVSVFVNIDGMPLSKYLLVVGYHQDAYSTNSDDMWFPVPSNKVINVNIPKSIPGVCNFRLIIIGYC